MNKYFFLLVAFISNYTCSMDKDYNYVLQNKKFILAVKEQRFCDVKKYVENYNIDVNCVDATGQTALFINNKDLESLQINLQRLSTLKDPGGHAKRLMEYQLFNIKNINSYLLSKGAQNFIIPSYPPTPLILKADDQQIGKKRLRTDNLKKDNPKKKR